MTSATAVIVAVTFTWLGMVLAISFLEAPLKFRAPDVTLRIGLGIGRLVFRALNTVETVLAATILITVIVGSPSATTTVALAVAIASLAIQLIAILPRLTRRSNAVLAGHDAPRSHGHYAYVAVEFVKVAALLTGGITALANAVA
ncbi:hypothetical protein [Nocardia terpenica]|uniref:DUF4149 domain-containing protein n=1 Tax=Nocardia terpenica TaxID=455432 RepID=A0A291RHY7_9NOCA|nr:hypothetical protein [Nocardia terpenica]ATL66702.1 hypothetical protein CRH09_11255 [Nocardia terpenica]